MPDKPLTLRKPPLNFNLQRMEQIFEQAEGETDVPHRHDYYTVLLVEKAKGAHLVDYHRYPLADGQVHFVSPGQVHQVHTPEKPSGWVITFSRTFLAESNIPETFISNINLFREFGDSPPLELDEADLKKLTRTLSEMEKVLSLNLQYRNRALGSLLQLFLIYCSNSCSLNTRQLDEENTGVCLLRDFKSLVDRRFSEWHKVSEYAAEIPISAKHLSYTVKSLTGKTAKELIQDRLLLEAKRLLLHTDLSIKEVAYRLGFHEPLHFSGFFKNLSGQSPTTFRNSS